MEGETAVSATHPVPSASELGSLAPLLELDRELVKIGRKIKVLNAIDWPLDQEERFLSSWQRGKPELPSPGTRPQVLARETAALEALMKRIDRGHPIGNWLYKSAWSYYVAAKMLAGIGTPEFTRCSTLLYGRPDFHYRNQDVTNAQSAQEMLDITDDMIGLRMLPSIPSDIPAEAFAVMLRDRIGQTFKDDKVEVVLNPILASKASASSKQISLRSSALFSLRDLDQLTEHEAYIHTLTSLNGRHQPYLKSLSLGAPRTTVTQEGLATWAEIFTGAIDIARLRRIALRVVLLKQALDGADFIEIFRAFLAAGQTEVESYRSAARLFRGGNVHGKICFTKDGAYIQGVMLVHVFIRKVLQEGKADLLGMLFAGRLSTSDVLTLAHFRDSGVIARPHYVPPWARDPQRVLATMAFSAAQQRLRLENVDLQRFVESEEELIAQSGMPG